LVQLCEHIGVHYPFVKSPMKMKAMKIAILHGPRDLSIEEQSLDTSHLQPDEIWVETRISALKIGTDRGNYEGAGAPDYPRWMGDSNLGIDLVVLTANPWPAYRTAVEIVRPQWPRVDCQPAGARRGES